MFHGIHVFVCWAAGVVQLNTRIVVLGGRGCLVTVNTRMCVLGLKRLTFIVPNIYDQPNVAINCPAMNCRLLRIVPAINRAAMNCPTMNCLAMNGRVTVEKLRTIQVHLQVIDKKTYLMQIILGHISVT